jgi:hypothetical protein
MNQERLLVKGRAEKAEKAVRILAKHFNLGQLIRELEKLR